jgi:hypothetical protein
VYFSWTSTIHAVLFWNGCLMFVSPSSNNSSKVQFKRSLFGNKKKLFFALRNPIPWAHDTCCITGFAWVRTMKTKGTSKGYASGWNNIINTPYVLSFKNCPFRRWIFNENKKRNSFFFFFANVEPSAREWFPTPVHQYRYVSLGYRSTCACSFSQRSTFRPVELA